MKTGSCECKSINYQYDGEPLTCYTCHCTDCQTSSGSAFGLSMIVNEVDVKITKGSLVTNNLDYNGVKVKRHHCEKCGSNIWFSADIYPGIIALKPGTFDDTSWFKPIAHLWTRSAQLWVVLSPDIPQFEQQPEMSELMSLWESREK